MLHGRIRDDRDARMGGRLVIALPVGRRNDGKPGSPVALLREALLRETMRALGRLRGGRHKLGAPLAQTPLRARDREAVRVEKLLHLEERVDVPTGVDALTSR